MGLSLSAGQLFVDHEESGQYRVAVINQEAADLYFSGKPLGTGIIDNDGVRTVIIGVVRPQALGAFQPHAEPTVYFPMWQDCPPRMTLIIEASKLNGLLRTGLLRKLESVPGHNSVPVVIKTLSTQLAQSAFAPLRIATTMVSTLASTALLLSFLGLFSAQRDDVRQRRHELALHIALGAPRWRIVFMILKRAARLAFAGTVTGTLVAFALLRVLIADTAIVSSPPLRVWLIAPLVPMLAVLITSIPTALRASIVDPMTIMREDN
jgi:hypothetical protein